MRIQVLGAVSIFHLSGHLYSRSDKEDIDQDADLIEFLVSFCLH